MQVTTSGTDFYTKAIHTLWVQVAAISIASIVWIAAVVSLEPQLGGIGMRTPIIPLSVMVSVSSVDLKHEIPPLAL